MHWDQIESNWNLFKRQAKLQWSKLAEAQLEMVAGSREGLARLIEETYVISKHAAEWQLSGWQLRQHDNALHV